MSDGSQQHDRRGEDASRVVITVLGGVLVLVGLGMLVRQWFWPYFPLQQIWATVRGAGWGLGLIIIGIVAVVWTQRPGFKAPPRGAKIYRSRKNRMVGGVLGGLSEYLGIDATLLRLAYVALALMFEAWPAIVAYIAASIIVPEAPKEDGAAEWAPPAPPTPPAPPPPPA